MKKAIILTLAIIIAFPVVSLAQRIGVGVGTGTIRVSDILKAGQSYNIPPIVVINTGDVAHEYGVGVQWREYQTEFKPLVEWFKFKPDKFFLEPGESQLVKIELNLPIRGAEPGDYFAFLQGFPVVEYAPGQAGVGIAAASKLYFTVAPANIFLGVYYKTASMLQKTSPWSYIILGLIALGILIVILRRFMSFNVSFKKKN